MNVSLLIATIVALAWLIPGDLAAENQACVDQCRGNYTYPNQPSTPCCGCCAQTSFCHGNAIFSTCCNAQQDYCGCISNRAACSGSIFNSTYRSESNFGTCYPKGFGTCFYDPNPNYWVVCPTGFTGCISSARGATCCSSSQTCSSSGECVAAGPALCNGAPYDASAYDCTTNDQGQKVLCSKGFASCGQACYSPSQYCCQNGGLRQIGQCSATLPPATSQTSQTTQTTQSSRTTQTTQVSQPPATSSAPTTCNGAGYDRTNYDCTTNDQGQQVLCPKGLLSCGQGCYSASQYCCQNGGLRQVGQCSATLPPATTRTTQTSQQTTSSSQPPATSSGPSTCNGNPFNSANYDCTTNNLGEQVLCPKGGQSCGRACYSPSQYCCQDGNLKQVGQCYATLPPPASSSSQPDCLGIYYDPAVSDCTTNEQGQSVLCPKGRRSCGQTCYDPAQQCCDKGSLGGFDKSSQYCCPSISDRTVKPCPIGQHCCGNILNGTSYFGPENLYTACYDPTLYKCCYGGTSSYLNPATIEPINYSPPAGAVRFCQA